MTREQKAWYAELNSASDYIDEMQAALNELRYRIWQVMNNMENSHDEEEEDV